MYFYYSSDIWYVGWILEVHPIGKGLFKLTCSANKWESLKHVNFLETSKEMSGWGHFWSCSHKSRVSKYQAVRSTLEMLLSCLKQGWQLCMCKRMFTKFHMLWKKSPNTEMVITSHLFTSIYLYHQYGSVLAGLWSKNNYLLAFHTVLRYQHRANYRPVMARYGIRFIPWPSSTWEMHMFYFSLRKIGKNDPDMWALNEVHFL